MKRETHMKSSEALLIGWLALLWLLNVPNDPYEMHMQAKPVNGENSKHVLGAEI